MESGNPQPINGNCDSSEDANKDMADPPDVLLNSTASSQSGGDKSDYQTRSIYKLYRRRWFMLAVVAIFSLSNAMIWISYAPVPNLAADYYSVSITTINWFSLVFFISFIPCGFLSFWLIDSIGLKTGVLIGTWLNAIGALVRMIASVVNMSGDKRFAVALTGQIICGCAQPMALSMPTKLAALWFGDKERTIANTISSVANPVGVLIANVLAAVIVQHGSDIKLLVIIMAAPCLIVAVMATFGFRTDEPPTPPSASAKETSLPFKVVLSKAFGNKHYVILMVSVGIGIGLFSTLSSLVFEIICARGYSNTTAGIAGAMVIVGGLIGSTITSLYVDKTKKFEVTIKVTILMVGLSTALLLILTNLYNQRVALGIGFFVVGFFALGAMPVSLELGVEITYPLAEATTSGLQWMTGQVVGIALLIVLPYLGRDMDTEELKRNTCTAGTSASPTSTGAKDLMYGMVLMAVLMCTTVVLFVIYFKADLRRLRLENDKKRFEHLSVDDDEDSGNA